LASSRTAAKYVLPPLAESGPAIELPVIIASLIGPFCAWSWIPEPSGAASVNVIELFWMAMLRAASA